MYRVMVVNSNMDYSGVVCKRISEGDLIPYDSAKHTWEHAVMVRDKALELFPAVIIICDEDFYRFCKQHLSSVYGKCV